MMKLTVQQVFDATQTLNAIINARRPMPLKGAYRLSRLHAKLKAEFDPIVAKRDEIITGYDCLVWVDALGNRLPPEMVPKEGEVLAGGRQVPGVPADKVAEFNKTWGELASEEVEIAYDPIPLAMLDLGDKIPGSLTALELSSLGDMIVDEAPA